MGVPHADGAALAVAAIQQSDPQDALRFLAAASAKANIDTMQLQQQQARINSNAAFAVTTANLASEGVGNSDATCDDRNKRQNTINEQVDSSIRQLDSSIQRLISSMQHLSSTNEEQQQQQQQLIEALQSRTARVEGMIGRVVTTLLNNNVDASQVKNAIVVTEIDTHSVLELTLI